MTNQQLYLAIGLPILVNLLTTGLIMLYVNAKIDGIDGKFNARFTTLDAKIEGLEKSMMERLLRVEQVIDARLKHLEEK